MDMPTCVDRSHHVFPLARTRVLWTGTMDHDLIGSRVCPPWPAGPVRGGLLDRQRRAHARPAASPGEEARIVCCLCWTLPGIEPM